MKSNICIAIPIKTNDFEQNLVLIKKALNHNVKYIELRFDYIKNPQLITKDFIKKLIKGIQNEVYWILTFRHDKEKGYTSISDSEHYDILKTLITSHPAYVDIELRDHSNIIQKIVNLGIQNKVKLIFSYHNFSKTPNYETAKEILENFHVKLSEQFLNYEYFLDECIFKLIFTARTFQDNTVPLKLCKFFTSNKKKIISFCMGEQGIFSRIMATQLGSAFTFASLEDKTAEGQINIDLLKEFYEIL